MYYWMTTIATLAIACVTILYFGQRAFRSQTPYPLPPGPPGLPWVGNVIGIDIIAPWITYTEWARTYGGIVYSRLLGKNIIIINSENIAMDLLERRSGNYSDRPDFHVIKTCGQGFNSVLLRYGSLLRMHRRFLYQTFRPDAVSRFLPLQHHKACNLLRRLFDSPEQLSDHAFEYTTSIILNSTYDYDPAYPKDELVCGAENVLGVAIPACSPNKAILVRAFPLLRHLPSWLPGMSLNKEMAIARTFSERYLKRPFEYSAGKMQRGSTAPSMVYDAFQSMEEKGIIPDESWMETLKNASGTAFLAGSETSTSVLMTIFLMMLLNPTVQEKAQAQIDAVVGKARLPAMDDRPLLPLIDAIFRETLRCHPITPLLVAHAAEKDDVYDGFYIPKGATVIANIWSMTHDESKYPDPYTFMPERYLNEDGSLKPNDTEHIMYGFGRRICVGRHFADTSVWSVVAKVLAIFKILKALDENGVEIPVEPKFSPKLATQPLPFGYRLVPRFPGMDSESLERLIAASSV